MDKNFDRKSVRIPKQKRMRPRRPLFLIPIIIIILVAAIIITTLSVSGNFPFLTNTINTLLPNTSSKFVSQTSSTISSMSENTSSVISVSQTSSDIEEEKTDVIAPDDIKAVTLNTFDINQFSSAAKYCAINKLNTIILPAFFNNKAIYDNTTLQSAVKAAHDNGVLLVVDINISAIPTEATDNYGSHIVSTINNILSVDGVDGIMLSGYGIKKDVVPYTQYLSSGYAGSYDEYIRYRLTGIIRNVSKQIKEIKPTVFTVLKCDAVWAKESTDPRGIQTKSTIYESYADGYADTLGWINSGWFEFAFIDNMQATTNSALSFTAVAKWWQSSVGENTKLCMGMYSSLVGSKQTGWSNPDQLTRQLMVLSDIKITSFAFDSYSALVNDKTGSTSFLFKYLSGNISKSYVLKDLTFTSPSKTTLNVTENHITFVGASDPEFPITMNGNEIERTEYGYFSIDCKLSIGKNTFTFVHKGKTVTYNVTYRYVVLKSITPVNTKRIDGSSILVVSCVARQGSAVTATFNGTAKAMTETTSDTEETITNEGSFCTYTASFQMPDNYTEDKSYGKIVFRATHNGVTESLSSGDIVVLKTQKPVVEDTTVYPTDNNYTNVGSGLIGEVVKFQAETFTGTTVDDKSQAYNNYLPKGTVDYISPNNIHYGSAEYVLMRCGKRLYLTSKGVQNVKVYNGTLPATNNISVASTVESDRHTTITFNVDWKAPFDFQLKNQNYNEDRTIDNVTFSYVSINFCYAGTFDGTIELAADNPVFSGYEIIKNEIDYTLILKLRKTAGFYGWSADYNEQGQLVFKFLKPVKITPAENDYGYSLNGVKICIDAGHGGSDGGSPGAPYSEADLNLILAQKLQSRLEALGATVIMTRTDDSTLTSDQRILKFINSYPDLMVSIHRNAAQSTKPNGFGAYYFNAFSKSASQYIFNATKNAALYNDNAWTSLKFHYFYMCRFTVCPTVLTENGFMTNSTEYNNLVKNEYNDKCADALTKGIINYFKSIQ